LVEVVAALGKVGHRHQNNILRHNRAVPISAVNLRKLLTSQ
jgi:hypothetical protein